MALLKYDAHLPDKRTLSAVPTSSGKETTFTYTIDRKDVTEAEAEKVWDSQGHDWHRGRTLPQALRSWVGRG